MTTLRTPDPTTDSLARWTAGLHTDAAPQARRRWRTRIVLLVLAVLAVGVVVILGLADAAWFEAVGFGGVWSIRAAGGTLVFLAGALGTAAFLLANLAIAAPALGPSSAAATPDTTGTPGRIARVVRPVGFTIGLLVTGWSAMVVRLGRIVRGRAVATPEDQAQAAEDGPASSPVVALAAIPRRSIGRAFGVLAVLVGLAVGLVLLVAWPTIAAWQHAAPFGGQTLTSDAAFGMDLGWWMFTLPFLHLVAGVAAAVTGSALLLTAALYGVGAARVTAGGRPAGRRQAIHLGVLTALVLLALAALAWLARFDLAYAKNGLVTGVGATDAAVRLPVGTLLAVTLVVAAVLSIALAVAGKPSATRRLVRVGVAWVALLLVAGFVVPPVYQQVAVTPSQDSAERSTIEANIAATRLGFNLDGWQTSTMTADAALTTDDIAAGQATFSNLRLWDAGPLQSTLDQLQSVRQYYGFSAVDADRYQVGGTPVAVMVAAREMALDGTKPNPGWVARHVLYTHGYGAAVASANAVVADGLPSLLVRDLPPVSSDGAPVITSPAIYFGRRPSDWVLANARSQAFDYPAADGTGGNSAPAWTGTSGIPLSSPAARLLWAARLGDVNLLTSDQVTSQTQLLWRRSLADRLGALAPFLTLDPSPYLVIDPSGRLVWVQDAYTTSSTMPASTAVTDSTLGLAYDYIRDAVRITVDATDGTTHLYLIDPNDPIAQTWAAVYPGMFEPASAMPAGITAHLRVPAAMFDTQVQVEARYHVTDPQQFYTGADVWTPSSMKGTKATTHAQGSYVEMALPGGNAPEFVLAAPMLAAARPNMVAWIAARNDGASLGQVVVYRLPAGTTVQGPPQVEARIDQDPTISAQLSLWNQGGSKVIRGTLSAIPVNGAFIYVEPVYLQSTTSAFPQLTRVVVASNDAVAWGRTLQEALTALTTPGAAAAKP